MKHSILIVDDNPGVTSPMAEYLENAGLEVRTAESSQEAVKALGGKNFSLVITDLRMETGSDSDGLQFVRHVRSLKPGLPVFILTASGSPDAATEGIRLQVNKFLGKPISMPRLLAIVRQFLDEFYGASK
jgi:two-component system, NtrC family, nitrogen regulation response regulator NtrX